MASGMFPPLHFHGAACTLCQILVESRRRGAWVGASDTGQPLSTQTPYPLRILAMTQMSPGSRLEEERGENKEHRRKHSSSSSMTPLHEAEVISVTL